MRLVEDLPTAIVGTTEDHSGRGSEAKPRDEPRRDDGGERAEIRVTKNWISGVNWRRLRPPSVPRAVGQNQEVQTGEGHHSDCRI